MNAGKLAAPILLMAMLMTSLMAIAIRNLVDEGLSVFDATFLRSRSETSRPSGLRVSSTTRRWLTSACLTP